MPKKSKPPVYDPNVLPKQVLIEEPWVIAQLLYLSLHGRGSSVAAVDLTQVVHNLVMEAINDRGRDDPSVMRWITRRVNGTRMSEADQRKLVRAERSRRVRVRTGDQRNDGH